MNEQMPVIVQSKSSARVMSVGPAMAPRKHSLFLKRAIRGSIIMGLWLIPPALGLAAVPPTPSPTYSFDTGTDPDHISIGGSPADANIAASSTHVCLTARAAFACYTKSGTLVAPGPGFQARPYTAKEFFEQSGITIGLPFSTNGTPTKDARIVFDNYRKRFFMVFQSREPIARLLIAVSKSEDPRDGWWTYADTVGTVEDPLQDYQWLGVNATHLLVANIQGGSPSTTYHYMYTTPDLVVGKPYTRSAPSIAGGNKAVPCVHDSYTTDAFWILRNDDAHATVWAVRNGLVTSRQVAIQTSVSVVNGSQLGGTPVYYDNIGRTPQNCHYRDGKIVFVSNDGHTWSGQSSPNNAVRLVKLNVSHYFDASPSVTVELDRIFGLASASDPAGNVYDYGWPAVAVNATGDIVVGSVRSHATIYPEQRGSVWFAGQPDISSSVSLKTSSSPLSQFHMAGASADPSTPAIYLAQQYGSTSPSWRMHVAKMLGSVMPDVIATQVQPPATTQQGSSGSVTVKVMNQGDGPMPASQGKLYLSSDNVIDLLGPDIPEDPTLATFSVPSLVPNQVETLVVPFTIAATQIPGNYFVGARLDIANAAQEYSEDNNLNPFLAANHGNAGIIVEGLIQPFFDWFKNDTNAMRFHFMAEPFFDYTVEFSDSLNPVNWVRLTSYRPRSQPIDVVVTNAFTNAQSRFFRIRKEPCNCP